MAGYNLILKRTLSLLEEGETRVELDKHKNVTLVIGNSGSGKTTFTEFIAVDNKKLRSIEIGEDTGNYLIVDDDNKISSDSTILSQTIFPDLIVHEKTHAAFYDMPGFSDTRNTAYDIASAYFIHTVIEHAENVKLLFIVNYSSVSEGVDRHDFLTLLKHATNFIPNIDYFRDSIALIVTKVDNRMIWKKGVYTLVPDSKEIDNIARFLENAKSSIKSIMENDYSEKRGFYENSIKLINIFLTKKNENYSRIGLFRRPNQSGLLSEISFLQDEKYYIEKMIDEELKFVANNVQNFGYTISDGSRNEITHIVAKINKEITEYVADMMGQIENYYTNYVKRINDIDIERDTLTKAHEILLNTVELMETPLTPIKFIKTIQEGIQSLDIRVSTKTLEEAVMFDKYLNFLQMISSKDIENKSTDWLRPLEGTVKFLQKSKSWYDFLIDLYDRLSKFDVQQNKVRYGVAELQENLKNLQEKKIQITGDSLKDFLYRVYEENIREKRLIPGFEDVKHLEIDEFRLKQLNKVLDVTFGSETTASCFKSNELIVHGPYVKMSDVSMYMSKDLCPTGIDSLKIFSSNKIFIDVDLVQVGSKLLLTVIAPTWEIIGERKIILDGTPGTIHSSKKAKSGIFRNQRTYYGVGFDGMNGNDGLPGVSGGSAGSFFGIADIFINENHLKITANGGDGSDGQDGGDGADGARGRDANWDNDLPGDEVLRPSHNPFTAQITYMLPKHLTKLGRPGGKGGNGGNGGMEGYGGNKGEVVIYGLLKKPNVQVEKLNGRHGTDGKGGKGGLGGDTGDYCTKQLGSSAQMFFNSLFGLDKECGLSSSTRADRGKDGIKDVFSQVAEPGEAKKIQEPSYIVNDYKNYLRQYVCDNWSREANKFYEKLNTDISIKEPYDTLGLINEFQGIESQYHLLNGYIEFLPIYQSLMQRVEEYARSPKSLENSKVYKRILGYLYAAILGKVCSIRENGHNDMVIQIVQYLNMISHNIEQFQQLSKDLIIKEYSTNYKEMVDHKIAEATYLIDNYIQGQLSNIQKEINKEINILIDEMANLKTAIEVERNNLLIKRREQMKKNILKAFLGIMKVTGSVVKLLCPVAAVGETIINTNEVLTGTFDLVNNLADTLTTKSISIALDKAIESTDKSIIQINEERTMLERDNPMNIHMIDREIIFLNDKLTTIKSYEKKIFNLILPMIKDIQNDLYKLRSKLKNMSQVSLQVSKWKVQNTLKDVKLHMRQIISEVQPNGMIIDLYERLNEGIDLLINAYDRIQIYKDQKTFADYISNINLNINPVNIWLNQSDSKLQDALTRLQLSIKSNIILDQYEKAMSALTQFIFPFAAFYIADFKLPSSIKVDKDLEDITSNAVEKIKSLQTKLIESEVSIQKHDSYVYRGYFFSGEEYLGPFFIWRNEQYQNEIKALLSGQEIILKANIMKDDKKNAVKFNEIEILFKIHNNLLQQELDERLKYFDVSLTHLGNSYYKCDDRYYVISSNAETLRYSLSKINGSTPISKNVVYNKLKNAPCMLSPYAMWKMKLSTIRKANFTILEKFGNLTDLELVGHGQYVLPDIDVCNDQLSDYYKESDDMSNLYEPHLKWEVAEDTNIFNARNSRSTMSTELNDRPYEYSNYRFDKESLLMTSGVSSIHESVVGKYFRWFRESISVFKSFNPIDYLNQWFTQESNENLYFNANQISGMINDSTEPYAFTQPTFHVNSSLVLADFFIRRYVTKKKYNTIFSREKRSNYYEYDREYAHSLAYNYYCPTKQNKNIESNFTTTLEYVEDNSMNNIFQTNSHVNVGYQDFLRSANDYQKNTDLLI